MKDFVAKVKEKGLEDFSFADISRKDLDKFCETIQEIQRLVYSYSKSYNRKQIADEITAKIKPLETFLWVVGNELKGVKNMCEGYEAVNDIDLAMNILVKLSNIGRKNYVLRKFYTSDFCFHETKHGDKEHSTAEGTVWLIGLSRILNSIEDKVYFGSELSMRLTDIVSDGCELVVCTDHYFATNVLPLRYSGKLEMFQIRTTGFSSDIKCYTHDGALQDAVTMFHSYIAKNSGDISGLNQDKLYEIMKNI